MTCGIDTSFLVHAEIKEAARHQQARVWLGREIAGGRQLALAPQVLVEFVHVVTDPARFSSPLEMETALDRAQSWWTAREVLQVHTNPGSVRLFRDWMLEFRLGRKRILDTLLAATYFSHGIREVAASDPKDFAIYGCFPPFSVN